MPRYEVQKSLHNFKEQWSVWDHTKEHFIEANDGALLESAAHIIAFALNAVAEGRPLIRQDLCACGDPRCGDDADWTTYAGPTEGVAP